MSTIDIYDKKKTSSNHDIEKRVSNWHSSNDLLIFSFKRRTSAYFKSLLKLYKHTQANEFR